MVMKYDTSLILPPQRVSRTPLLNVNNIQSIIPIDQDMFPVLYVFIYVLFYVLVVFVF